ncbi:MAG: CHAT domain-containing protein, partial [Planctomycetota bacterium]|nr:CHAT domain-containing protein [Planctomycetota bacterium]
MIDVLGDPSGTPQRRQGDPYGAGHRLFAALGGDALWRLLDASDDGLLLLECDDAAADIPWEYAATAARRFLACDYAMLRLEPRPARLSNPDAPPRLLVICADPLLYPDGALPAFALDFERELAALRRALESSPRALTARRVPPTPAELRAALAGGPSLLHFSCHGRLVEVQEADGSMRQDVMLALENEYGELQPLLGRDLVRAAPRGSLRLALLSACQSAPLARALVRDGVPVALGMQHNFPDPLSDELVAAFYRYLCSGNDVAEAVRQARLTLAEAHPAMMGLLVAYACRAAWSALPLPDGAPDCDLALPARLSLPENVMPPVGGLLGRNRELAALARALDESAAATVVGAGGMGKTALAATFARRFGWRFRRVAGVSFAGAPVDETRVCRELIERLAGPQALPTALEGGNQEGLAFRLRATLTALIQPGDLLIFDNYESVLTPDPGSEAAAEAVARLPWLLLDRGARLLLTSRAHPAGLPGERLIPDRNGMSGLAREAAADLFLQHCPKARDGRDAVTHQRIAARVAEETEGYPIAVQLLAAAYDAYDGDPQRFLEEWPRMLAEATARTPDPRHARFAAAVEFSLRPLAPEERERLLTLARLDFPFFAEAAALLWDLPTDSDGAPTGEALETARRVLGDFTRRSLLQIEGYFSDDEGNLTDQPATYRFQPALRQELLRRSDPGAPMPAGYAAYGAWLARRAYGELGRSPALANLVYRSIPALEAATRTLAGDARLWHLRRLASFRQYFGVLDRAREEPEGALDATAPGTAARSALLHKLAYIYRVQGELERALALYQESLAIHEALK